MVLGEPTDLLPSAMQQLDKTTAKIACTSGVSQYSLELPTYAQPLWGSYPHLQAYAGKLWPDSPYLYLPKLCPGEQIDG